MNRVVIASKKILGVLAVSGMLFPSEGICGKYDEIFTTEIYNQEEVLQKLIPQVKEALLTEEQLDEALEKHLYLLKENQLAKNCIERVESKIKILRKVYNQSVKREFWENAIRCLERIVLSGGLIGGSALGLAVGDPLIGGVCGQGVASVISVITNLLGEHLIDKYFSKDDSKMLNSEIRKLEFEILDLKSGLQTEPIRKYEIPYIKNKRKIKEESLRDEIERGLIEARRSEGYFTGVTTAFLKTSLNLPLETKILFDSKTPQKSRVDLRERFDNTPVFQNFSQSVRGNLYDIITQTAVDSTSESKEVPTKKAYYFSGDPSCGKTLAAKLIPEFLGEAYLEMNIRSSSDLSQMSLEGTERLNPGATVGWLTKPFIEGKKETIKDRKNYKNCFLIINDLDRILENSTSDAAISTLCWLLDYIDPQKTKFYSPFFNTYIDISHLNIIITANQNMKKDFFYDALKTRFFKFIEFPRFSDGKMKEILNNHLQKVVKHHHVPKYFEFTYLNSQEIRMNYDKDFLVSHGISDKDYQQPLEISTGVLEENKDKITLRELQSKLDNTLNHLMNSFSIEGKNFFELARNLEITQGSKESIKWFYENAALLGYESSFFQLGKIYENAKEQDKALLWYLEGSKRGDKDSIHLLGITSKNLLKEGQRLEEEKKYETAFEVYSKSDSLGNLESKYLLGIMYEKGLYVQKDLKKAFELVALSAERGFAKDCSIWEKCMKVA